MNAKMIEEKKRAFNEAAEALQGELQTKKLELAELICAQGDSLPDEGVSVADIEDLLDKLDRDRMQEVFCTIKKTEGELDGVREAMQELEEMRVCPSCGCTVDDDELFCHECGTRLMKEDISTDDSACPQCGKPRKADGLFCVYCGFRFESNDLTENAVKFCIKCGTELPPDVIFCHVCGSKQGE